MPAETLSSTQRARSSMQTWAPTITGSISNGYQGYDQSAFLVWFEGHSQALVISPTLPRGTQSSSSLDLGQLLALAVS